MSKLYMATLKMSSRSIVYPHSGAYIHWYCRQTGAGGALTKAPQNVVVLRGEDAILNCTTGTPETGNPILWSYDQDSITSQGCRSRDSGFVVSPPHSSTVCNLRALGTRQQGISGAYKCEDTTSQAVATVIVLGEWYCYFRQLCVACVELVRLGLGRRIVDYCAVQFIELNSTENVGLTSHQPCVIDLL